MRVCLQVCLAQMNCVLAWQPQRPEYKSDPLHTHSRLYSRSFLQHGCKGASGSIKEETGHFPQYINAWLCFVPDPIWPVCAKMNTEIKTNAVRSGDTKKSETLQATKVIRGLGNLRYEERLKELASALRRGKVRENLSQSSNT